jgi:orotate phosphoribosyltransferase
MLTAFKRSLIEFCLQQDVLQWGEFTLKSGRASPYFFNAGCITNGKSLAMLGGFYAQYILEHDLQFDGLFGPAYKGITLAATTAMALSAQTGRAIPFAYNRKEVKDHGEGGHLVGPVQGDLCVIDDVITSGKTFAEVKHCLSATTAKMRYALVCLDREERVDGVIATHRVQQRYNCELHALITLDDLIVFLEGESDHKEALMALTTHRAQLN